MLSIFDVVYRLVRMYSLVLFAVIVPTSMGEEETHGTEEHTEPVIAVLFPWFVQALGILVFFIMTRYIHLLPYTAIMFIIGMLMGIGYSKLQNENQLGESILQWLNIDSEVLLVVFLPGLIFKDAFGLNIHLFQMAFWQLVNFAFPMVLAGTCLTALVAFYIFQYDWSWNLSMTFGAILSATDLRKFAFCCWTIIPQPVAVSALLAEVGAPPRLKIHISGESLLNDGSALVFFQIFSGLYLLELGVEGLGEELTVGEGFAKFFRGSLGGTAIGLGFGLALVCMLYFLNRRLNEEENVVQVAATITIAYLTYYVADVVAKTSGVIAVVFCGITAKAFGDPMINDQEKMDSFWALVEHLLNTVLFALGGAVWGEVISNETRDGKFTAKDWGYLILLYVLLQVIRFFLMYLFYPLTSRIGLGTNWQETFFMAFGGLRGAVGISLAIALDNTVYTNTEEFKFRDQASTLFGMVGGVAFFTLILNGTLSGPVLVKLGLAASTAVREKIVKGYGKLFDEHMIDEFCVLLTDPRFHKVDYAVVSFHIPIFDELTLDQFKAAVEKNKETTPPRLYKEPYVVNVLSYLDKDGEDPDIAKASAASHNEEPWSWVKKRFEDDMDETAPEETGSVPKENEEGAGEASAPDQKTEEDVSPEVKSSEPSDEKKKNVAIELRTIFIELLRSSYRHMIRRGELDSRRGFLVDYLLESLDWAEDKVSHGGSLNDWEEWENLSHTWIERGDRVFRKHTRITKGYKGDREGLNSQFQQLKVDVIGALALMKAHWLAQARFKKEFSGSEFAEEEKLVIEESNAQVKQAVEALQNGDQKEVENVVSHLLCVILLNKSARYIESVADAGLLKMKEANHFLEEIEEMLEILYSCTMDEHGC